MDTKDIKGIKDIRDINTTALAYIGDAVYEVYIRRHVMDEGTANVDKLHALAVHYVRAEGQALAIKAMINELTEEEERLVKRARNRKITSKPKNADPVVYKLATAFEALIGFLYLSGQTSRLDEVINAAIKYIEDSEEYGRKKKEHKPL